MDKRVKLRRGYAGEASSAPLRAETPSGEELLAGVLESMLDAVIVAYPNGTIRMVNRAVLELLGYTEEDLVGKPVSIVFEEQSFFEGTGLAMLVRDGAVRNMELTLLARSGERIPVISNGSVIREKDGRLSVVIGVAREIRKRKQMQQALHIAEQNFRNSLDSSPLGICIVTAEDELLYANQAILDIYGYISVEELKAVPKKHLYTAESYAEYLEGLERRRVGKPVLSNYEISIVRKDGKVRHLAVFRKEVIWYGETQWQVTYQNITGNKTMESKLIVCQDLDNLKSNLLLTVSHELRIPLASIKGYCTMLMDYDHKLRDGERRKFLARIDRASDRQAKLIDCLLDMSQIDSGLLKLKKMPTSISKLVQEVVADAQIRAPGHRIELELRKRLPRVSIDVERIRQVLDNLIDNAVKYSEKGTEVGVSVRRTGQEMVICVSDQGIGIPAEELPHVFDRMYRVEQRSNSRIRGIGLGLNICRGLVEAHGGRFHLKSEVGRGSIFCFTIPIETVAGRGSDDQGG